MEEKKVMGKVLVFGMGHTGLPSLNPGKCFLSQSLLGYGHLHPQRTPGKCGNEVSKAGGWGLEQPGTVESVPAYGREWNEMPFKGPSNPICWNFGIL